MFASQKRYKICFGNVGVVTDFEWKEPLTEKVVHTVAPEAKPENNGRTMPSLDSL